jgi:hypothetical protein
MSQSLPKRLPPLNIALEIKLSTHEFSEDLSCPNYNRSLVGEMPHYPEPEGKSTGTGQGKQRQHKKSGDRRQDPRGT